RSGNFIGNNGHPGPGRAEEQSLVASSRGNMLRHCTGRIHIVRLIAATLSATKQFHALLFQIRANRRCKMGCAIAADCHLHEVIPCRTMISDWGIWRWMESTANCSLASTEFPANRDNNREYCGFGPTTPCCDRSCYYESV